MRPYERAFRRRWNTRRTSRWSGADRPEGEEALGLAERLLPDVILMDLLMPGKNGIDACREITTALPDAKGLMLTAFSDRDAMDSALAVGATGYLPKLWGRDQLSNTLRNVVAGRYSSSHPRRWQTRTPPATAHRVARLS